MFRGVYIQRGDSVTLLKKLSKRIQRLFVYFDQDGYFESAVETIPAVRVTSAAAVPIQPLGSKWSQTSALVVNLKLKPFYSKEEFSDFFKNVWSTTQAKKGLFINAAQAQYMLSDDILDNFDIIFKREPFKDRNKYSISDANKAKIVPTMIHCPFVHVPRNNLLSQIYHKMLPEVLVCKPDEAVFEVGFSGADAAEHTLRRDVWQRIVDEGFTRIGGLQPNPYKKEPIPVELAGPRLRGKKYRNALCAAKINLALKGIGEYTFRHQELLYLGAFMMSDASITELELPMPLEEGKHYVAFSDLDDMVEKIRYYLTHENERLKIAAAGKHLFDEYYNPTKHGEEILMRLEQVGCGRV